MKKIILISCVGLLSACGSPTPNTQPKTTEKVESVETKAVETVAKSEVKTVEKKIDYIQVDLKQFRKEIHLLTPKEFAFSSCLSQNYTQLGVMMNDASPFYYSLTTLSQIVDFVEKETGHYYREVMPMYSESGTKYNAIFSRCLTFYQSEKLDRFLKEIKPKKCTKDDDYDCPEINYDGE